MAEEFDNLPQEEQQPAPEGKQRPGFGLFDWLQMFLYCLLTAMILFNTVIRVTLVQGESMEPTLHGGELTLIRSLGYEPEPGDIVVLNKVDAAIPGWNGQKAIVKRVIAVGGQSVHIDYDAGLVYVDGQPLDEPYIKENMHRVLDSNMQQTHWEVPPDCIFVMGDNRNNSTDSRHTMLGCLDNDYLLGQVVSRFWPLSEFQLF